jgi:ribosomal protein S21
MTHPAKPKDHDQLRAIIDRLEGDSFQEWRVQDQPYVDDDQSDMDLDEKLKELSRRLWKAGRLEEAKQRQRYEKPSERKRAEREAQSYRAEEDKKRSRWRGGIER